MVYYLRTVYRSLATTYLNINKYNNTNDKTEILCGDDGTLIPVTTILILIPLLTLLSFCGPSFLLGHLEELKFIDELVILIVDTIFHLP